MGEAAPNFDPTAPTPENPDLILCELTPETPEQLRLPAAKVPLIEAISLSDLATAQASSATFIKESLEKTERSVRPDILARDANRRQSVELLFTGLGMMKSDEETKTRFRKEYVSIESDLEQKDPSDIADLVTDLWDKYDAHPISRLLDMLQQVSGHKEAVTQMRRMALILLEKNDIPPA